MRAQWLKQSLPGRLLTVLAVVLVAGGLFAAQSGGALGGVPAAEAVTSVNPGGPYTGSVGQPITFTGSAVGATAPTYFWTFGDGSSAIGPTVTHSYFSQGNFTVTLTVLAPSGTMGASTTANISTPGGFPFGGGCYFFGCNPFSFNYYGFGGGCYTQIFFNYNTCNSFQYPFGGFQYPSYQPVYYPSYYQPYQPFSPYCYPWGFYC